MSLAFSKSQFINLYSRNGAGGFECFYEMMDMKQLCALTQENIIMT